MTGLFALNPEVDPPTSPGDPGREGPARSQPASPATPVTQLGPGHPNPSRGTLSFRVELAGSGEAQVEVYDLRGALVRTLMQGSQSAGRYELSWDGRSNAGQMAANGLYFVRLRVGSYRATRSVLLVR